MIKTDIIIIGAGPTGLFTVFEAGLLKLKCHLIDALAQPGGQCSEIYPKKPIYDIPAYPEILAGDLTDKLLEQCKQFEPGFTLGERAEEITRGDNGIFTVTTNKGTQHQAPVVAIAGGLGSFEPRKPQLENLEKLDIMILSEVEFDAISSSPPIIENLSSPYNKKLKTPSQDLKLQNNEIEKPSGINKHSVKQLTLLEQPDEIMKPLLPLKDFIPEPTPTLTKKLKNKLYLQKNM